jgi:hypothetical protein
MKTKGYKPMNEKSSGPDPIPAPFPPDPIKFRTTSWPPPCEPRLPHEVNVQPGMHPAWVAGIEALGAYQHWVNACVLPIAFQWIEEHKPEVYANVPEELKDDVGVVMAAAFRLVKELPMYQRGRTQRAAYEADPRNSDFDPSTANPVWREITQKIRQGTQEAFEGQAPLLGDTAK